MWTPWTFELSGTVATNYQRHEDYGARIFQTRPLEEASALAVKPAHAPP
jgi:hypothetical protein